MCPDNTDWMVRHERCNDLLKEAERERLVGCLRQNGHKTPRQSGLNWLGKQIVSWGNRLQTHQQPERVSP